ncbi:hypothetical protein D3C72_1799150 [compost metagenome]
MSSRAALEGPATVERMKSLLSELEHLIAAEWLPEESKKKLSYLLKVQRATSYLESADVFASPASRRNDNDLPSRLMASELIRLNQEMFSAAHKRAVFQLMGLSFIERPLEMRTIERLIRAEKERRQRIKMPGKVESV